MPVMCVVQMPKGKPAELIDQTMVEISRLLMKNFDLKPNQCRVSIEELPRCRFIGGGIMDYEMPEFNPGLKAKE